MYRIADGKPVFQQGPPLPQGVTIVQASGGHSGTVFYVGDGLSRLFKSNGDLSDWTPIVPGGGAKSALRFFIDPYRPDLVYIDATAKHIMRSDDGGAGQQTSRHPRQNHLFVALREIGRIERSLFTLCWLRDPELRRRVTVGLNKGEAHLTLKRAIRFYRRGAVSDRTQLEQNLDAMALNLVVAAITLWNTAYLDRALQVLQQEGVRVPEECVPHISPLGWEHITITGTYHWKGVDRQWKRFRPLRQAFLEQLKVKSA